MLSKLDFIFLEPLAHRFLPLCDAMEVIADQIAFHRDGFGKNLSIVIGAGYRFCGVVSTDGAAKQ